MLCPQESLLYRIYRADRPICHFRSNLSDNLGTGQFCKRHCKPGCNFTANFTAQYSLRAGIGLFRPTFLKYQADVGMNEHPSCGLVNERWISQPLRLLHLLPSRSSRPLNPGVRSEQVRVSVTLAEVPIQVERDLREGRERGGAVNRTNNRKIEGENSRERFPCSTCRLRLSA